MEDFDGRMARTITQLSIAIGKQVFESQKKTFNLKTNHLNQIN